MLNIRKFFEERLLPHSEDDPNARRRDLEYATAALLLEVAKADFEDDALERAVITAMLHDTFDLSEEALNELVQMAESATTKATDVYQFTQLVNEHYHYDDKAQLVRNLWQVANADGRLDRYEEQFIRKVSGLIHVSHSDFIKAKVEVLEELERGQ